MPQIRKRSTRVASETSRWVTDPMARLLFKSGPPAPAREGVMPPFPFESLAQMRDAWLEARDALLPELRAELASTGAEPWAEREWGAGERGSV
jgi:hypothetical protein